MGLVEREEFRNRSAAIPDPVDDGESPPEIEEDDRDFDPVAYARTIRRSRGGDRRA